MDQFHSDDFSLPDKLNISRHGINRPEYRGHLGTPSGKFKGYNPQTNVVGPLP
jgi:hypothetical protein